MKPKMIKNYPKKQFKHAIVAVDVVIFSVIDDQLKVLLLELKEKPFAGMWALPGGLVATDENLKEAAERHLSERAGATSIHIEQLYTFGEVNRDPLGRVVSVAYLALVPEKLFAPKTLSRYSDIKWQAVKSLPQLAYDHKEIINKAYKRLKGKLSYTNIVYSLLPKDFTLTELQTLYEIILDKELDKRNFRKKINSLDLLVKRNKKRTGQPSRPAQLYGFKDSSLKEIDIL